MKPKHICLNISKRNEKYLDIIDTYADQWDLPKSTTIFRIVREYHQLREAKVLWMSTNIQEEERMEGQ